MDYETEWQFDAPDLARLRTQLEARHELGGFRLRRCPTRELTDSYLDTPDARLAHSGFALRLRGDGASCEATLKSLRSSGTGPLVRKEISQPLQQRSVAALVAATGPVSDRVRAVAGTRPLEPLLTVRTHRDVFQVMDGDVDAAEIALDDTRFGESNDPLGPTLQRVEVELHAAPAASLEPLLAELCGTLALEPARLSKLAVGLAARGHAAAADAGIAPLPIEPTEPAVAVGRKLLERQLAGWRATEPAVRLGDDPEALHDLRVTGRRIIASLRLLEAARLAGAIGLRRRMQALLRRLGPLRDLDVQRAELEGVDSRLPGHELRPLLDRLQRSRGGRYQLLLRLLDSPRVCRLFGALDSLAAPASPRRRPRPIAVVAEGLLRQRYRHVRRQARLVAGQGTVEQCHRLRLEAKKLRYVAEPLVAIYGEPMQVFLRRLQKLQTLLGRINDAHHASVSLERLIQRRRRLPAKALFTMGRVAERQQHDLEQARDGIPRAWRRVSGKSWRRLRRRMQEQAVALQPPLSPAVEP